MPRGQSKTPAEKAQEAVEAQQKTVDKLRKDVERLKVDIEKACAARDAAQPILDYEQGILDALKRHPALGQAATPVNLGKTPQDTISEALERSAIPEQIAGQTAIDDELVFTRGVETPKVEARPDHEGDVRTGMFTATNPVVEDDEPEPAPAPRGVQSSATNPWNL